MITRKQYDKAKKTLSEAEKAKLSAGKSTALASSVARFGVPGGRITDPHSDLADQVLANLHSNDEKGI